VLGTNFSLLAYHNWRLTSTPIDSCSVDRNKYHIQIPLPPKIDPTVTMMTVEEKPDVTYEHLGGVKEQIEKLREVVELPLLHVRRASSLSCFHQGLC